MQTLNARFSQDADTTWWTATVMEAPDVVAQGRTLEEAHRRVRQALEAVGYPVGVELSSSTAWNRPDLDEVVVSYVKRADDTRLKLLDVRDALEHATAAAVAALTERDFSYRAAGRLLGITHARVEQIDKESGSE